MSKPVSVKKPDIKETWQISFSQITYSETRSHSIYKCKPRGNLHQAQKAVLRVKPSSFPSLFFKDLRRPYPKNLRSFLPGWDMWQCVLSLYGISIVLRRNEINQAQGKQNSPPKITGEGEICFNLGFDFYQYLTQLIS